MTVMNRFTRALAISACMGASLLAGSMASAQTTIKIAHPNVPEHPMG